LQVAGCHAFASLIVPSDRPRKIIVLYVVREMKRVQEFRVSHHTEQYDPVSGFGHVHQLDDPWRFQVTREKTVAHTG
jgi:hypothetical protein